jgi:hypothetical protein
VVTKKRADSWLWLACAGLALAVVESSGCCLAEIQGIGDGGPTTSSSSTSTAGSRTASGSSSGSGGTAASGTGGSTGGGCVEIGQSCTEASACCESTAQCSTSLGATVCCVPDGASPTDGWPGDCCSQNGLGAAGACRPLSGTSSGGSSSTGGTTTGGVICPPGESSCFSNGQYVCTDLQIDPTNCGSCRFWCGSDPYCVDGMCQASSPGGSGPDCPPGLSSCFANGQYVCTNFLTDPSNCGQCRFFCGTSPYCVDGTCQTSDSTCSLTLSPESLNFGTVTVGVPVTKSVALSNVGQSTCHVVGVALSASSDSSFSLASGQAQIIDIPVGGSAAIAVQCDVTGGGSPAEHAGDVDYQSNDPQHLAGSIFLLSYQ